MDLWQSLAEIIRYSSIADNYDSDTFKALDEKKKENIRKHVNLYLRKNDVKSLTEKDHQIRDAVLNIHDYKSMIELENMLKKLPLSLGSYCNEKNNLRHNSITIQSFSNIEVIETENGVYYSAYIKAREGPYIHSIEFKLPDGYKLIALECEGCTKYMNGTNMDSVNFALFENIFKYNMSAQLIFQCDEMPIKGVKLITKAGIIQFSRDTLLALASKLFDIIKIYKCVLLGKYTLNDYAAPRLLPTIEEFKFVPSNNTRHKNKKETDQWYIPHPTIREIRGLILRRYMDIEDEDLFLNIDLYDGMGAIANNAFKKKLSEVCEEHFTHDSNQ